jgi:hypothetical protein
MKIKLGLSGLWDDYQLSLGFPFSPWAPIQSLSKPNLMRRAEILFFLVKAEDRI